MVFTENIILAVPPRFATHIETHIHTHMHTYILFTQCLVCIEEWKMLGVFTPEQQNSPGLINSIFIKFVLVIFHVFFCCWLFAFLCYTFSIVITKAKANEPRRYSMPGQSQHKILTEDLRLGFENSVDSPKVDEYLFLWPTGKPVAYIYGGARIGWFRHGFRR